jgi:hypothetical protein
MSAAATAAGLEQEDGNAIGRDPLLCSRQELETLGHAPVSAQAALRLHCLDCCGNSAVEVRCCTATACPSWPFRLGRSPWKEKRVISDETREKLAASLARGRAARSQGVGL